MFFDLGVLDILVPAHFLCAYQVVEFPVREGLHGIFPPVEILYRKCYRRVHLLAASDNPVVFGLVILADEIFFQGPASLCRIPGGRFCGNLGNQSVVLYFFEGEPEGRIVPGAEGFDVCELSWSYLVVDIPSAVVVFFPFDILCLEGNPFLVCVRYDKQIEPE